MAVITSGSFAKALWPGVNAWYGKAYNEYPVEWDNLFEKNSSTRAFEEDVGVSGLGLLSVKPEASPITYDSERQAYVNRYTHITYASGFVISREIMEDDQYDVVGNRKAQSLAFSVRQTKENIAALVYNRAFNASYTGGDGKELLATDHPLFSGGTWANELSTASDLSEAALEQAHIDIAGFTNDRGLLISVRPKTLILPRQLMFEGKRVTTSHNGGRPGTDTNDVHALKALGLVPEVVVNHYLTDTDAWFLRTDAPHGMKYFSRRADAFDMDNDFDTENAKFKATFRCSFGWTDPRGLFGSPGA